MYIKKIQQVDYLCTYLQMIQVLSMIIFLMQHLELTILNCNTYMNMFIKS